MALSNALKYKIDTYLLLIDGNVPEVHHQSVLLIEVSGHIYLTLVYQAPIFPKTQMSSIDFK